MAVDCTKDDCLETSAATSSSDGLPFLILIITLVLCSILLATIALIIIVVITKDRRKRLGSLGGTSISYDDLAKPGFSAVEVQPDMRTLDLRGNHRGGFMPYAQAQARKFLPQGQFNGQRRLISVPEEEGHSDESRHSRAMLLNLVTSGYNNPSLEYAEDNMDGELDDEAFHGDLEMPSGESRQLGQARGFSKSGT